MISFVSERMASPRSSSPGTHVNRGLAGLICMHLYLQKCTCIGYTPSIHEPTVHVLGVSRYSLPKWLYFPQAVWGASLNCLRNASFLHVLGSSPSSLVVRGQTRLLGVEASDLPGHVTL